MRFFALFIAAVVGLLLVGCSANSPQDKIKDNAASQPENKKAQFDPNFTPAVLIQPDDYKDDKEKQSIANGLVITLQALVDRDKEKFDANFVDPKKAETYHYLFDPEVQYRFDSFEIVQFVNPTKAHVTVKYSGNTIAEGVEEALFSRNATYFLEKTKEGQWKVTDID
ncbi:hypothetical protein [Paenibacillus agilis]|uniref:DUF4829 domain-containing protein n=1 Tax=Paenibacillus agilis TaxID=3020863 RepID=A0A559IKJ4_9BACL|nr:hypothetical protein [Paenibacillus agilis]TVX88178.1 hypothetical protein FPZ44_19930 [Paenibacillus agilis]